MIQKIRKLIMLTTLIISGLAFGQTTLADGNDYLVRAVLPENQNPDVSNFFDLTVSPGQKQTLQVMIANPTDSPQKFKMYINTATTNQNGIVDYTQLDFERDESMKVSLKDCITIAEPQIEVPANSEKEITMELTVPAEAFEGILLGGITIEPDLDQADGGSSIFTRTIAIQLSETENEIAPEMDAGEVTIAQDNLHNNVRFELRNVTPTLISKVKATTNITKKGSDKPILEQEREQLSFAPNSKFNLMSEWNQQFQAGEYTYSIQLTDEAGHEWSFIKDFVIEADAASKLNKTSVDEASSSWKDYAIHLIASALALIIIGVWIYRNKKKQTKAEAN
ncbi:DUF916 and DUF3324 domain-containing protein [Enterococcus sp. 669A]|uniref:DUF916 and DUF3324 domain-containing protein n=1 Tax=Candidatus Enterococcus moelleringii TaxID=2815325 RepID=A0ABS3LGM0_9ENTE|nr:DUF916 and DUF3324 domain-containing protein [Enterococcus sp. 669A]MBO1308789.1 DUF916 and DUF3324 domain-containing protein [Enterococcus sp. 669A]